MCWRAAPPVTNRTRAPFAKPRPASHFAPVIANQCSEILQQSGQYWLRREGTPNPGLSPTRESAETTKPVRQRDVPLQQPGGNAHDLDTLRSLRSRGPRRTLGHHLVDHRRSLRLLGRNLKVQRTTAGPAQDLPSAGATRLGTRNAIRMTARARHRRGAGVVATTRGHGQPPRAVGAPFTRPPSRPL